MNSFRRMALGIILCAWASTASAVPLSNRPGGSGPQYFGYFASNNQSVGVQNRACAQGSAGDCTALLSDLATHTNVVNILGGNDWVANRLAAVQAAGMGAVVFVQGIFGDPSSDPFTFWNDGRNWMNDWNTVANLVQTYVDSGTIVSFYVGEEPRLRNNANTTMANLATMSGIIRQRFPNVHQTVVFDATSLDVYGWSALNPGGFTISPSIDWVGYDCYSGQATDSFLHCYSDGQGRSVAYYIGRLRSVLNASGGMDGRGIVLLPDAYLHDTSAQSQAALLTRIEREAALADNDPSIVMIMPFLWDALNPDDPSLQGAFGVDQLPTIQTYYRAWGLKTTQASAGGRRLAYPTSVSANYSASAALYAFDYTDVNVWNSNVFPAAGPTIAANFLDPIRLIELNLVVDQNPSGPAQHTAYGLDLAGASFVIAQVSGNYSDEEWVGTLFSIPLVTRQIKMVANSDPSWVAWRDIEPWTIGSTRLYAYPISATSSITMPEYISDGDTDMVWNSGRGATMSSPVSIDLDLGAVRTLSRIELVVDQSPAGFVSHTLYGGPSLAQLGVIASYSGNASDGQTLAFSGSFGNVRYIRITTTQTPSWVAWREISLFQ